MTWSINTFNLALIECALYEKDNIPAKWKYKYCFIQSYAISANKYMYLTGLITILVKF